MRTGSFPGVKRPGRGVDHPPPTSGEVKDGVELYLWAFVACYRVKFTVSHHGGLTHAHWESQREVPTVSLLVPTTNLQSWYPGVCWGQQRGPPVYEPVVANIQGACCWTEKHSYHKPISYLGTVIVRQGFKDNNEISTQQTVQFSTVYFLSLLKLIKTLYYNNRLQPFTFVS